LPDVEAKRMLTKTRGPGKTILLTILLCGLACSAVFCEAQEAATQPAATKPAADAGSGAEALQKATQNPVASLISVPVQNNDNFGIGPFNRIQNVLNIQPVVPVKMTKDWNVIIRGLRRSSTSPLPAPPTWRFTGLWGRRRHSLQ